MFHEIHADPATQLMTGTAAAFLDHALGWLKRHGWELVSLDEGLQRLAQDDHTRRFAVVTFDDGYRDILDMALPILESHSAPFTIYVPTASLTRTLFSWWLGLRALILANDAVEIEAMGRRLSCRTLEEKTSAFGEVQHWIREDFSRASVLKTTFRSAGISLPAINDGLFLGETELMTLSRHPLSTIGAHTQTHAVLSSLDEGEVRRELNDNRAYLEGLLQMPVTHLAYPYGSASACSEREAREARALDFRSAATTRFERLSGTAQLWLLPRVAVTAGHTPTRFAAQMNGILFGRPARWLGQAPS